MNKERQQEIIWDENPANDTDGPACRSVKCDTCKKIFDSEDLYEAHDCVELTPEIIKMHAAIQRLTACCADG